jgi:hypothetical protein
MSQLLQVVDVDENQHSPEFGAAVVEARIAEDAPPDTLLVAVPVTDADIAPLDSAVTYRLVGSEGLNVFYVNHLGEAGGHG